MDATTGALIVAAIAVIATPLTAWLTFRWGRDQERDRWEHEREFEGERWRRQEDARRTQRGEEAATELIGVVDAATALMSSMSNHSQSAMAPAYQDIRRLSLLLTDDDARSRMLDVANDYYFFGSVRHVAELGVFRAAYVCSRASHDVLRAYLLGRPILPSPELARLTEVVNKGEDWVAERIGDNIPDILDEPQVIDATKNVEGSGSA